MTAFLLQHSTAFSLVAAWLFSALFSTMPPIPEKAGYWLTWAHNFLQFAAANTNKIVRPQGV